MKKTFAMMAMVVMCGATAAYAHDDMDHKEKAEMKAQHCLDKVDTNKDNMVSMAEQDAASKKMFMEADANNDKMLSKQEIVDAKMKEMNEWKEMKEHMKK